MDKLLTKKELAERWQVTEKAIDNWRKDGTVTPCKGIPSIRFSLQHIAELEGVKIEKFSLLERKSMEREIETLKQKLAAYEDIRAILLNVTAKIIDL